MKETERSIRLINEMVSYKPKSRQAKFKKELLELMLTDNNYSNELKKTWKEELSKMSAK